MGGRRGGKEEEGGGGGRGRRRRKEEGGGGRRREEEGEVRGGREQKKGKRGERRRDRRRRRRGNKLRGKKVQETESGERYKVMNRVSAHDQPLSILHSSLPCKTAAYTHWEETAHCWPLYQRGC